ISGPTMTRSSSPRACARPSTRSTCATGSCLEFKALHGLRMQGSPAEKFSVARPTYSLWDLVRYFTKLGTIGFGGPVALVGYMQRDLVEDRKWISEPDFKEGL